MAAKKEKKNTSIPSEDAVAAIDDCLRCTTGIEFYGATTKSYRHHKDPDSSSYCTVPVKYQFNDKDEKIRAEKILRDLCDVQCTTPYPILVRECIRQIIAKYKGEFPESLIRVNVDCNNMCFKAARKEKGAGDRIMPWIPCGPAIPIPEAALDVLTRKIPEDFKLSWPSPPIPPQRKPSQNQSNENGEEHMSTEDSPAPPPP
jgi:hypothetical protein